MAIPVRADLDSVTQTVFRKLMAATIDNDYDKFVAVSGDAMKASLTKEKLEDASKQIASRAKKGYEAQFLGDMKRQGYDVYIWRLRFKDGGDDVLATLSMKDGKAAGLFLN